MTYALLGVAAGGGILGFLAGLLLFKVKARWCPVCGGRLRCVDCLYGTGAPGTTTREH
jgi:hypothetical protein